MRSARLKNPSFFRTVFAALLTLAILSSAVPFAVLSAAHSCSMPCCAGSDGGCATGACQALFKRPKKSEEEKLCGAEDAHPVHGATKHSTRVHTVQPSTNPDHCGSEEKDTSTVYESEASSGGEQRYKTNLVSALVLSSSCSNNCCAGASTQSRRWRNSALLFAPDRALPPAFISLSQYSKNLPPVSAAHLRRLRARAPPITPTTA